MVLCCKIKEDFHQKMAEKYKDILEADPCLDDIYGNFWAVFDALQTGDFQVWIENSYGECLMKCKKEQFKDLFDFNSPFDF